MKSVQQIIEDTTLPINWRKPIFRGSFMLYYRMTMKGRQPIYCAYHGNDAISRRDIRGIAFLLSGREGSDILARCLE